MFSLTTARHAIANRATIVDARSTTRAPRARVAARAANADREMWYPGAVAPKYLDGTMAGDYGARRARRATTRAMAGDGEIRYGRIRLGWRFEGGRTRAGRRARSAPGDRKRAGRGTNGGARGRVTDGCGARAGFDPLRLGANPETLPYLQEAELMNGRWAMAATAGILFTDAVGLPKWWEAGAVDYGMDFQTLVGFQVVAMSILEAARTRGFMKSGESGVLNAFPFDPAGLDAPDKRVKEVKNARLAMVAFLGMVSQYAVTGLSPLEGLEAHMANPQAVNLFTSSVGGEAVAFIAFLSTAPTFLLAQKTLGDGSDEEFRPIPW